MKIITVSIAAYNVESYIEQCLDSFADERLRETLEVLIINDGSTDNTALIAERYVQNHPEIFRLINKENGGHGSTINRGIQEASGKYFKPVDGDDWVDTENLITIIDMLRNIDSDLVITDFCEKYMKTGQTRKICCDSLPRNELTNFCDIDWKDLLVYHNMIYVTNVLQQNDILVSEKVFFEDTEYVLFPLKYINTFYYMPSVLYYYRLEREGQSCSVEGIIKHINDLRQITINLFKFYIQNQNSEKIKKDYYKMRIIASLNFYYTATHSDLWFKSEQGNRKRNQLFYKTLLFISPTLFLSYMLSDRGRIYNLLAWFNPDAPIFKLQKSGRFIKKYIKKLLNKQKGETTK